MDREPDAKGYVYSLWTGQLKVEEGDVYNSIYDERLASFITKNKKKYQCALNPGIIYNGIVWLLERDDNLARQIMIDYEEGMILKLEDKISNHRHKITMMSSYLPTVVK